MRSTTKKALLIAAVAAVLAAAGGTVYWFRYSQPEKVVHKDVVSARVGEMPVIDGSSSDDAWDDAQPLAGENFSIRSVHDGDDVALLFEWDDPTLSLGTAGAWQLTEKGWRENRTLVKWESFAGKRHPEWLGLYWNINSSDFSRKGCTATCHDGTNKHHMTPEPGERVDTWHVLAKHGWGPAFVEDQGWLAGSETVEQSGEVSFADEAMDSRQPVTGSFTFTGYGEDAVLTNPDDSEMRSDGRPAVTYCSSCHDVPDSLLSDAGAMPYERNIAAQGGGPRYIETRPADFADAMVLTAAEVADGEAVEVVTLDEVAQGAAWDRYVELNATVPQLVLSTPDGSSSDLRVAAEWKDGHWTVEVVRALATGASDDVQFDDLGEKYEFAVSLWDKADLAGDVRRYPLLLSFEE